jgi:hypothetical protein
LATVYIAVTAPLQNAIGVGWLFTILVLINILSISCIVLVYLKGKGWREKHKTEET